MHLFSSLHSSSLSLLSHPYPPSPSLRFHPFTHPLSLLPIALPGLPFRDTFVDNITTSINQGHGMSYNRGGSEKSRGGRDSGRSDRVDEGHIQPREGSPIRNSHHNHHKQNHHSNRNHSSPVAPELLNDPMLSPDEMMAVLQGR